MTAGIELRFMVRDVFYITSLAIALALVTNTFRTHSLPLITKQDFDILVPCPEPSGIAVAVPPDDPRLQDEKTLLIDARSNEEYEVWHLASAINFPFDWLAEQEQISTEAQVVARKVARSGKHAVVVYGDGGDPDSGQQWAALLNTAGIRNVTYVSGGSAALRNRAESKGKP